MADGRRSPDRPHLAASLACFRDGAALLARRAAAPALGLWSLPGGMVELGEPAAAAALRELAEETGVAAEVVGLADMVEVILRDADGQAERHVVILAFAGRWRSGEGEPGPEAAEVAWVRPERLGAFETTPDLARVIARAAKLVG